MVIAETVKRFLFKTDFDWEGNISIQQFHPQLEIYLAMNGIFFNKRESKLRFLCPLFSSISALSGIGLSIMYIWHGILIKNYQFATENFCYVFILMSVFLVYSSVILNRERIFLLLSNMNDDFYFICNLGGKYRETFLKGQLIIWQLCWDWFSFAMFVVSIYISNTMLALLYQSTMGAQDEHTVRPFIFPVWLPEDDPHRTPNYEIFMTYHIAVIFVILFTFVVYVYTLFHLLLHYYILMDMILIAFEEFFEGLDESVAYLPRNDPLRREVQMVLNSRMKRIVCWHLSVLDSVDAISSIYGPPLMYQVMFSSVVICLMAYQIAEQLEEGTLDYLFGLLGIGGCAQLWIPCYIGSLIQSKGFSLADGCWNSGWDKSPLGCMVRQDFIIFILRAQQPVAIKFTCLPSLQLETFSSIMTTAYSYFNMMRQYY